MESFERYAGFLPESGLLMMTRPGAEPLYDDEGPGFRAELRLPRDLPVGAFCDTVLPEVVDALPYSTSPRPGAASGPPARGASPFTLCRAALSAIRRRLAA